MKRGKIAIIGGGAAGLAAAWSLARRYDVTLFESESSLGGHAFSQRFEDGPDHSAHIDMGVDYFNERLAPNLMALLDHLGVATFVAPLSMRFEFAGRSNFWSNTSFEGRVFERLRPEFDRFHADMAAVALANDDRHKRMSIAEYVDARGYSEEFKYMGLVPLMTIYSGCKARSLDFNLTYAAISFQLNLLSFFCPGYWRKCEDGMQSYVAKIERHLAGAVELDARIRGVRRDGGALKIEFASGEVRTFDRVILATHADTALSLIAEPRPEHREILGGFEYNPVTSYAHQDSGILSDSAVREYAEFQIRADFDPVADGQTQGHLTRISNNLFQYRDFDKPLLVTFDPTVALDEAKVLRRRNWKLPKLRPRDFARKREIGTLQGLDGLYFCGTDSTLTGHEGALVSGLVVAQELGVPHPFADNAPARAQFEFIQSFMGFTKSGAQS